MATKLQYEIFTDDKRKGNEANNRRFVMQHVETGWDDEREESVHIVISKWTGNDRIIHALEKVNLDDIKPDDALEGGVIRYITVKSGAKYMVWLSPAAISFARILQNKRCHYCHSCVCRCRIKYPQGWKHYPGDVCKHGTYVGGCGIDWMCGPCEMGED